MEEVRLHAKHVSWGPFPRVPGRLFTLSSKYTVPAMYARSFGNQGEFLGCC